MFLNNFFSKYHGAKLYRFIKTYSQICALNSCDKRNSEKLTVNREMTYHLTVNRQNHLFLTVNRQRDPPPPINENKF